MEHNVSTENATRWSKILFATAMLYLLASSMTAFPESNELLNIILAIIAFIFLGLWISFPYVLYKDRKQMFKETEWNPSKLYYFGFLPSPIGAAVILLYLYRRNKLFDRQELKTSEEYSDERPEFME